MAKKRNKKVAIMKTSMNRYSFNSVFRLDPVSNLLYTIYPTSINGVFFQQNTPILRGPFFGGLDLYKYLGRDVIGNFMQNAFLPNILPSTLLIIGFA